MLKSDAEGIVGRLHVPPEYVRKGGGGFRIRAHVTRETRRGLKRRS